MHANILKKVFLLRVVFLFTVLFAPALSHATITLYNTAEMWWCSGCGLSYPASTKHCLNKDCPLFVKPK